MAEEETEEQQSADKPSRTIPVLLGVVMFLLTALGGTAGYIAGMKSAPVSVAEAEAQDQAQQDAESAEAKRTQDPDAKAVFLTLRPEFTANFNDGEDMRFMQVGMDVMARDERILDRVEALMPQVRYEVLKVLSRQGREIYTPDGKEAMLGEILGVLQKLINTEAGTVEDVFYTSFLIQ